MAAALEVSSSPGTTNLPSNGGLPTTLFEEAIEEVIQGSKWSQKDVDRNPFLAELIHVRNRRATGHAVDENTREDDTLEKLRQSLKELESQKKASQSYRILDRLSPFLKNLHSLVKLSETMAQSAPFGVGIAFSGARIVLKLAFDVHSQFETVLIAMENIGERLGRYDLMACHDASPQMRRVLIRSYKNIIEFWLQASQILSRSTLKQLGRELTSSLHTSIQKLCDALDKDSVEIHQLSSAEYIYERKQESLKTAQRQTAESEKLKREKIATWVRGQENLDANPDLKDQLKRQQDGTCLWILEDQRFKDWCDARKTATIWYNAPPGSGKSVLASSVIQYLKQRQKKVVMYFFSFNSHTKKSGKNGLRSLTLQLLSMTKDIPDKLNRIYEDNSLLSPELDSYDIVGGFMHQLLIPMDEVFVVIDGLDEAIDESLLLESLDRLIQADVYGTVKWFITSRDHPPSIRDEMESLKVVEIRPGFDTLSSDIQKYVAATMICPGCFTNWAGENEINFLYARFVCETLQRKGLTRETDVWKELHSFPKDLDSYYVRSLEKIASGTKREQELIMSVFVILIGAAQSISLRELVDALSIELGTADFDERNALFDDTLIEKLCGPIITLDRNGVDSNPKVKFYHKTVRDFLLQRPDMVENINEPIRNYFVNIEEANRELGLKCLTYLMYSRYMHYLDCSSLVDTTSKDHAFLSYAATFWWKHLDEVEPTSEMLAQVSRFLKSPAFWNCLRVQSRVAPYLFGRYTRTKSKTYLMRFRGSQWNYGDSFGIPLPSWFLGQSNECTMLDQSLCHFAEEWREVITTCPDGVDLCVALRSSPHSCYLKTLSEPRLLRAEHLQNFPHMDSLSYVSLLSTDLVGKKLLVDVIYRTMGDLSGRMVRVRGKVLQSKAPTESLVRLCIDSEPSNECVLVWDQETVYVWNIDLKSLSVSLRLERPSEVIEAPHKIAKYTSGSGEGEWLISTVYTTPNFSTGRSIRSVLTRWKKAAIRPPSREEDKPDADSDNDSGWSSSEDGEENGSEDEHEPISSDDEERPEAETAIDRDLKGREPGSDYCLIFLQPHSPPLWSKPWKDRGGQLERIGLAAHPTRPLLAFTNSALQVELINLNTRIQTTKPLPEPVRLHAEPAAVTRDLRFSSCGNFLYGLSVSFISEKQCTSCHLTLSTYNVHLELEGDSDEMFLRAQPPIQCTYTFLDRLIDLAVHRTLTLTFWDDDCLLIALPPLTCDPKIIVIDLPKNIDSLGSRSTCHIRTLEKQLYFPASTPLRDARLLFKRGSEGENDYIYLALGAFYQSTAPLSTTDCGTPPTPSQASPPVFLHWRIPGASGWRAWDPALDEASADSKREAPIWVTLRGTFVDSGKSVSVLTRCGLDWTRKGYLSCG